MGGSRGGLGGGQSDATPHPHRRSCCPAPSQPLQRCSDGGSQRQRRRLRGEGSPGPGAELRGGWGGGNTGPLGASGPLPHPAATLEGLSSRAALKSTPYKAPSRIAAPARLHSCCGTPLPGTEQNPDSPPGQGDPSPNPLPGGGLVLGTAKPRGEKAPPRNVPF